MVTKDHVLHTILFMICFGYALTFQLEKPILPSAFASYVILWSLASVIVSLKCLI